MTGESEELTHHSLLTIRLYSRACLFFWGGEKGLAHFFSIVRSMTVKVNDSVQLNLRVPRNLNRIIAHAASLMLTGVPPEVCETVITGLVCSVKRSLTSITI